MAPITALELRQSMLPLLDALLSGAMTVMEVFPHAKPCSTIKMPERRTPNRSDPQRYPRRHVQPPIMPKPENDALSNSSGRGVSPVPAASSSRYSPYQRSRTVKIEPDAKIEPKQEVLSGNGSPERSMAVKLEPKEEVATAAPGENNHGDETDSENERD